MGEMNRVQCSCGAMMECAGYTTTGTLFVCACGHERHYTCTSCPSCRFYHDCTMHTNMPPEPRIFAGVAKYDGVAFPAFRVVFDMDMEWFDTLQEAMHRRAEIVRFCTMT